MLTLAIALLSPSLSPGNARQARVDIDITGDGRREIFIARDYQGFKAGDEFEILSPQSDGTLRPYGRLAFNLAIGFRVDGLKKRLIVLAPAAMGEATRIEYAIAPGLPKVGETRLLQGGATVAQYDEEFRALDAYWGGGQFIQAYADSANEGLEPVWKDLDTGLPLKGLRRLTPQAPTAIVEAAPRAPTPAPTSLKKAASPPAASAGRNETPPSPPSLADHFLKRLRLAKQESSDQESVWLIEVDVIGDDAPEALMTTSANSSGAGFMVYTPKSSGYRFIGSVPIQPGTFRLDAKDRLLIDEDPAHPGAFVAFSVTDSGVRKVSRPGLPGHAAWLATQRELARRFRDQFAAHIMAAPFAAFGQAAEQAGWRSLVNGTPASPITAFTRPVLNP